MIILYMYILISTRFTEFLAKQIVENDKILNNKFWKIKYLFTPGFLTEKVYVTTENNTAANIIIIKL